MRKRSITDILKNIKWNYIKCLIKSTKDRKKNVKDKKIRTEKGQQIENNNQKMIGINPTMSVITLIINDLNTPI